MLAFSGWLWWRHRVINLQKSRIICCFKLFIFANCANQLLTSAVYENRRDWRRQILVNEEEFYLVQKAQIGDDAAFARLIEIHARRIFRLTLSFCRNASDAEDLSQEVWLRAHKSLGTFRGEALFYTWLRQIMIRVFLSHRPRVETVCFDEFVFAENSFAENADRKILADKLREILLEFNPQQRLMFLLKHEEGMTYEEIAQEFDCSSGTVKKSIFRTIHKLRQRFGVNLVQPIL